MNIPIAYLNKALCHCEQEKGHLVHHSVISQECIDERLKDGRPAVPASVLNRAIWLMQADDKPLLEVVG